MRAFRSLFVLGLIFAGAGFAAGKKPSEFRPQTQMTDEELAEAKERSKGRLNGFEEKASDEQKDLPWLLIGLVGLSFLVATPFAIRVFRDTSKEISESARAVGANRDD